MRRARFAAVTLSAAPPKLPGERMRTSANTSVPRSSAIRSISPRRQRQLRSTSFSPAARSSSAQRSSARAPSRFMAGLTNGGSRRLTGTLYVVATPIGNLADASPRAIETLRGADLVACEDTRTSRTLLAHYGISARTVALPEHNERSRTKTLEDLLARFGPDREIVLARELSKKFEEVARMALGNASDWLAQPHREQGEFVLVLAAGEERAAESVDAERVLDVLLEALAPSEAAKLAARITGVPKNQLYRKALERAK